MHTNTTNLKKRTNLALHIGGIAFATLVPFTQAAVVIVDPPDSSSIEINVRGFTAQATLNSPNTSQASLSVTSQTNAATVGVASTGNLFSSGESLAPTGRRGSAFYRFNTQLAFGAEPGLNYARLDVDVDGIFETVIEFNVDGNQQPPFTEDHITRYFFDDTGAALDIPEALNSSSIPEPTTLTLALLGITGLLRRTHR